LSLIIVWVSLFLNLDFPDSFENPGNPNKKAVFFILWISPILCLGQSKQKLFFFFPGFSGFLFGFHLDPTNDGAKQC
jgi:hypothetical protein